jgi:hypothetical protein
MQSPSPNMENQYTSSKLKWAQLYSGKCIIYVYIRWNEWLKEGIYFISRGRLDLGIPDCEKLRSFKFLYTTFIGQLLNKEVTI